MPTTSLSHAPLSPHSYAHNPTVLLDDGVLALPCSPALCTPAGGGTPPARGADSLLCPLPPQPHRARARHGRRASSGSSSRVAGVARRATAPRPGRVSAASASEAVVGCDCGGAAEDARGALRLKLKEEDDKWVPYVIDF